MASPQLFVLGRNTKEPGFIFVLTQASVGPVKNWLIYLAVMQLSYRDRPCIAWYIHVHNLSREGFSGPSKIRASAVVSLPNMVAELLASAMKR